MKKFLAVRYEKYDMETSEYDIYKHAWANSKIAGW